MDFVLNVLKVKKLINTLNSKLLVKAAFMKKVFKFFIYKNEVVEIEMAGRGEAWIIKEKVEKEYFKLYKILKEFYLEAIKAYKALNQLDLFNLIEPRTLNDKKLIFENLNQNILSAVKKYQQAVASIDFQENFAALKKFYPFYEREDELKEWVEQLKKEMLIAIPNEKEFLDINFPTLNFSVKSHLEPKSSNFSPLNL